jgi:hypothetical protein
MSLTPLIGESACVKKKNKTSARKNILFEPVLQENLWLQGKTASCL